MRFVGLVCVGAILAALLVVRTGMTDERRAEKPEGKKHTVEMVDNEFKTKDLTVEVGDTVVWVNKGKNKHSATADKKDDPNFFDTGALEPDKTSKPIEFKKEGKVPYHCEAHRDMKATITVKGK